MRVQTKKKRGKPGGTREGGKDGGGTGYSREKQKLGANEKHGGSWGIQELDLQSAGRTKPRGNEAVRRRDGKWLVWGQQLEGKSGKEIVSRVEGRLNVSGSPREKGTGPRDMNGKGRPDIEEN